MSFHFAANGIAKHPVVCRCICEWSLALRNGGAGGHSLGCPRIHLHPCISIKLPQGLRDFFFLNIEFYLDLRAVGKIMSLQNNCMIGIKKKISLVKIETSSSPIKKILKKSQALEDLEQMLRPYCALATLTPAMNPEQSRWKSLPSLCPQNFIFPEHLIVTVARVCHSSCQACCQDCLCFLPGLQSRFGFFASISSRLLSLRSLFSFCLVSVPFVLLAFLLSLPASKSVPFPSHS